MSQNGSLYLNSSFFHRNDDGGLLRRAFQLIALAAFAQCCLFAGTVAITLSPRSASLSQSQSFQMTASVTGSTQTGVTWSLNGAPGSLGVSGTTAVYTAPAVMSGSSTITITATSLADATQSAYATVQLAPVVTVSVSPGSYSMVPAAMQQFIASVGGTQNTAVNWSINPQIGTIDNTGVYTSPSTAPPSTPLTITVTATSVADPTVKAASIITLQAGVALTMGSKALSSVTYNGQQFIYLPKSGPVISEFKATDQNGNPVSGSIVPTSVTADPVANTITNTYNWGTMITAYTAVSNKLKVSVTIQNASSTNTITHLRLFPIGIQFPQNPQSNPGTDIQFGGDTPSSVFFPFTSGAVVLANDNPILPLETGFWPCQSPAAQNWQVMLSMDLGHTLTNWPTVPRPIAPNGSDQYNVSLRWGPAGATQQQLTSDIFALYVNTYPAVVGNPPVKHPIASLFLSTRSRGAASVKNPRGWFSADPKIDVTTSQGVANFQSRLLAYADTAIAEMQRVGALGGILWDIEGQQTDESYVGDVSQAEALAPELVGVLDTFVNKFTSAGLKIGFTMRSQVFTHSTGFANVSGKIITWAGGAQFDPNWLPSVTVSGAMLIGTNNYQIQSVDSPTQITLTTSVASIDAGAGVPFAYNSHIAATDPSAEMIKKVTYAENRWGGSLFYIDSDVSHDGNIDPASGFLNVLNAYPGVMLFPEWKSTRHYAYSFPFNDPANNTWGPPAQTLLTYPHAAALIRVSDQTAASSQATLLGLAQAGNILLFDGWYRHPANDVVQQIYAQIP